MRCAATVSPGAYSAIDVPICTTPCCRSMAAAEIEGSPPNRVADSQGRPPCSNDPSVLPDDLVFVDLETTGGNAALHRITEVGILRVKNGELIDEWSSLVNPECPIPSYIEAVTGISNEMVADAPRFADIAASVLEKLR